MFVVTVNGNISLILVSANSSILKDFLRILADSTISVFCISSMLVPILSSFTLLVISFGGFRNAPITMGNHLSYFLSSNLIFIYFFFPFLFYSCIIWDGKVNNTIVVFLRIQKRVWKILKTKFTGGNIVRTIKTWTITKLKYSTAFLDWTISDLQEMDRKMGKLMTLHYALHHRNNVDHQYITRSKGGRGLPSVEYTVNLTGTARIRGNE